MNQQQILLLEDDVILNGVLSEWLSEEGFAVTLCDSLADLQAAIEQFPNAVAVCDSWARDDFQELSAGHRAEIIALTNMAEVVLTTGRAWAKTNVAGELGSVQILHKPYELSDLLAAVQIAFERSGVGR